MLVCSHCFAIESQALLRKVAAHGSIGNCPTCETPNTLLIEACRLEPLFTGLRNFYEVAEHGDHFGSFHDEGETIVIGETGELLRQCLQEWPIFNDDLDDETVESILDEVWPDRDAGCLYTSERLWDRSPDGEWEQIKEHVTHCRRYFQEFNPADILSIDQLLDEHLVEFADALTDLDWCRARVLKPGQCPFTKEEMGPPEREFATAGRANPAGIPYLYLASNEITAAAEVRAEPGHFVMVAGVRLARGLRVLDLAQDLTKALDPFDFPDLRAEINRRKLLRSFAQDLSRPIIAETSEIEYVATQYLSEYFASHGFDGILYPSSMTDGRNLVLFDVSKAETVAVESYYVTRKILTIQKMKPIDID